MTRVIVWTIVGLAVVASVIFLVVSRKGAATYEKPQMKSDKAYEVFVVRYEKRLVQMTERATEAKGAVTNPTPEIQTMITELDQKLADFTTAVGEMRSKTIAADREEAVRKVQALYRDIRKLIRDIGGTVGSTAEEGDDGE